MYVCRILKNILKRSIEDIYMMVEEILCCILLRILYFVWIKIGLLGKLFNYYIVSIGFIDKIIFIIKEKFLGI